MRNLAAELERREHQRVRKQIPCEVQIGSQCHPGTISDLSEGGLFLRCDVEARRGALVKVDFSDLSIEGEVVHSRTPPVSLRAVESCGMGLRFLVPTLH